MPVSDELLLKLIYKEENQKALSDAQARLENMSDAEKKFMMYEAQDAKLLSAEMDRLSQAQRGAAESSNVATDGFSKMQAGLVTLNAGIGVAREAVAVFKTAWDFTKEGASIERIQQQFKNLATSVSVDANRLLDGLNKAARGTVDDEELMQTATRAMALGLSNNADDLVKLMEIARASSVAFGGDTASAFERISTAVENLTPRALKQSGIIVNLDKAYSDYAISLGKTADALTDDEKRQALLNDVLQKGEDLVARIGSTGDDSATKIARLETQFKDLGDTVKSGFAEFMIPALDRAEAFGTLANDAASAAEKLAAATLLNADASNVWYGKLGDVITNLQKQLDLEKQLGLTAQERNLRSSMAGVRELTPTAPVQQTPEQHQAAVKAFGDFQTKLTGIENKGDAERQKIVEDATAQINKIESDAATKRADIISKFAEDEANRLNDMRDKRIDILTSYSEAEQQITDEQNKNRLALARSFGVEAERAEEDHQRNMARMAEDHGRRLSKLADSRDALGIEDEQANYQLEARRAEQDYQTTAQRRSEDYAQQLADLNASAEEQRQARAREKDKQLADLADQFAKQDERYQTAYQKQLTDLDKQTEAQRREMQNAETKKLADQRIAQQSEHDAAVAQWTQWRNEHQIFFAGEKALYDDYLKHLDDQLRVYIGSGGGIPTAAGSTSSLGHKAMGGGVDAYRSYVVGENGPEILRMGSRGGYVEANGGKNQFNVSINVAGTNATPQDIKTAVYQGIIEVMQAARK